MGKTIKSSTTKHTNGATSMRHRVIIQHPSAPDLDEASLSLDAVMRKSNPTHPKVHVGGSIGRSSGRSDA